MKKVSPLLLVHTALFFLLACSNKIEIDKELKSYWKCLHLYSFWPSSKHSFSLWLLLSSVDQKVSHKKLSFPSNYVLFLMQTHGTTQLSLALCTKNAFVVSTQQYKICMAQLKTFNLKSHETFSITKMNFKRNFTENVFQHVFWNCGSGWVCFFNCKSFPSQMFSVYKN